MKFLAFQLGAMSIIREAEDKFVLNGKHTQEDLMKLLDTFISKYVLCRKCENPETIIKTSSAKISLTCKACGETSDFPPIDKFETFISKSPAAKEGKVVKKKSAAAAAAASAEGSAAAAAGDDKEGKVVKKKVVKKKVVKKSPGEQAFKANLPVYAIESEINLALSGIDNKNDVEAVAAALRKIYDSLGEHRNCEHMAKAIYSTIFNGDVAGRIVALGKVLAPYTAARKNVQFAVLAALNESVVAKELEGKNVPGILKLFFDEDVLAEENIVAWMEENKESVLAKEAEVFVNWLKTAELED